MTKLSTTYKLGIPPQVFSHNIHSSNFAGTKVGVTETSDGETFMRSERVVLHLEIHDVNILNIFSVMIYMHGLYSIGENNIVYSV